MSLAMGAVLASALAAVAPCDELPRDPSALLVFPNVQQSVQMFLSDGVTAGGVGGGAGIQLVWRRRYVGQADLSALWGIGNTWSSRLAFGVQLGGFWAPALWGTASVLLGDRVEMLAGQGNRPAAPSWGLGLQISPLRFLLDSAFFSALEPSLATDFGGGLLFDLTVVRLGVRL